MKTLILLAGAALLASTGPAFAKPNHAKHAHKGQHAHVIGSQHPFAPGVGGCPPGLAKKTPRCVPPGQAKHLFNVGQRLPYGRSGLLGYDALPYDLRHQYGSQLDPYGRYYYQDDYLYRVDPATMVVQQILHGILR